jgi:hypothetical protein
VQLAEDARQLLPGYVEERRVREHAVEARRRQVERQEVLSPHFSSLFGVRGLWTT